MTDVTNNQFTQDEIRSTKIAIEKYLVHEHGVFFLHGRVGGQLKWAEGSHIDNCVRTALKMGAILNGTFPHDPGFLGKEFIRCPECQATAERISTRVKHYKCNGCSTVTKL